MEINQLNIIEKNNLTENIRIQLNTEISRMIHEQKDNQCFINRMVFDCITVLTAEKNNKDQFHKESILQIIDHSAKSCQQLKNDNISSLYTTQYVSQIVLQQLADGHLMSFDLITAVISKLNMSPRLIGKKLERRYKALKDFFIHYRDLLANQKSSPSSEKQNEKLLVWLQSVKHLKFNEISYPNLDDISKIVCLIRDFYHTTQGKWSTADLFSLKTAMEQINISPSLEINDLSALKKISEVQDLTQKLLNGQNLLPIKDPSYLISLSTLKRFEDLFDEKEYITDSALQLLAKHGVSAEKVSVCRQLVLDYIRLNANAEIENHLSAFDFILNFLYELKQAESEHLLTTQEESIPEEISYSPNTSSVTKSAVRSVSENPTDKASYIVESPVPEKVLPTAVSEKNLASLFLKERSEKTFHIIEQSAQEGDGQALYLLGEYYRGGYGLVTINLKKANQYFLDSYQAGFAPAGYEAALTLPSNSPKQNKIWNSIQEEVLFMARSGDFLAENVLGMMYQYGRGVEHSYEHAAEWILKSADQGFAAAQKNISWIYTNGRGVKPSSEKAAEWIYKAALQENPDAQNSLGIMYENGHGLEKSQKKALEWFSKAAGQDYRPAQYNFDRLHKKMKN